MIQIKTVCLILWNGRYKQTVQTWIRTETAYLTVRNFWMITPCQMMPRIIFRLSRSQMLRLMMGQRMWLLQVLFLNLWLQILPIQVNCFKLRMLLQATWRWNCRHMMKLPIPIQIPRMVQRPFRLPTSSPVISLLMLVQIQYLTEQK